jgi:hypothetical protein
VKWSREDRRAGKWVYRYCVYEKKESIDEIEYRNIRHDRISIAL